MHFFFPHVSLGHNTLPWPGLEPMLSNLEPGALTTGLLDKAMVLACPQYSWPRMLKVAPCTVVHPNFFRLDGSLLFCIIMGLHSASSTITNQTNLTTINVYLWAPSSFYNHNQVAVPAVSFCGAEKKIRRNVSLLSAKYYKFD